MDVGQFPRKPETGSCRGRANSTFLARDLTSLEDLRSGVEERSGEGVQVPGAISIKAAPSVLLRQWVGHLPAVLLGCPQRASSQSLQCDGTRPRGRFEALDRRPPKGVGTRAARLDGHCEQGSS